MPQPRKSAFPSHRMAQLPASFSSMRPSLTTQLQSASVPSIWLFSPQHLLFPDFLSYRQGKGGRKRGRETSICGCLSRGPHWPLSWPTAHNPGMCPDWESNQQPSDLQLNPLSYRCQGSLSFTCSVHCLSPSARRAGIFLYAPAHGTELGTWLACSKYLLNA